MTQTALFFPFTHITREQADTLSAFFPEYASIPEEPMDQAIRRAQEYLEWAKIHKGNEQNLKSLLKQTPYFTSDTHVTAIKSKLKAGEAEGAVSGTDDEFDSTLADEMLFLAMAEMSDAQNEQIDMELAHLDKNREALFSELRGSGEADIESGGEPDNGPNNRAVVPKDAGEMMTARRVKAWSACMKAEGVLDAGDKNSLWVTTSPAVFEYLESNCEDVVNALDIDQIKVHEHKCKLKAEWQHLLYEFLMQVVRGGSGREEVLAEVPDVTDGCRLTGRIRLNLFPGKKINTLLNVPEEQVAVCLVELK